MFNSIKAKLKKIWYIRFLKYSLASYKIMLWKKQGMKIGDNCHIYSDIVSKEPYLISIGDNTTISGNVIFLTHDNSICKYLPQFTDTFGEIIIGRNCFIGMNAVILPGVIIPDNTIVGAGSVVVKSLTNEGGYIYGGNPAKIIGTIENAKIKNEKYGFNIHGLTLEEKRILLLE